MAGFFKKIFSFGKKEVVEERIDETAPLPVSYTHLTLPTRG